jgi:hypothetical protein
MDSLKQKIVEKLEHLPEPTLMQVLEFIDFLSWRRNNREESSLSITDNNLGEELGEKCPVEYVGGVLVVQAASSQAEGQTELGTVVHDLREERLRKLASW